MSAFRYVVGVVPPANVGYNSTTNITGTAFNIDSGQRVPTPLIFHPITNIVAAASPTQVTLMANISVSAAALVSPMIDFSTPTATNGGSTQYGTAGPYPATVLSDTLTSFSSSSFYSPSSSSTPTTGTSNSATSSSATGASAGATESSANSTITSSGVSNATNTSVAAFSGRHSTGEVVGAAIGCLIAGAVIAGIVALFFVRRKTSRHHDRQPIHEKELSPLRSHGDPVIVAGGASKAWEQHLPQSESDQTIRNSATGILDHIEEYVDNFYRDESNIPLSADAHAELASLESDHLSEPVATLLAKSGRSTTLIKHCIAERVLSSISYDQNSTSFLPRDFTTLPMMTTRKTEPGFGAALSQWRVLTFHLRQSPEQDAVYHTNRDKAIITVAQRLCRAFQPWARSDDPSRLTSLIGVMKRASGFGIVLFSQPATFRWQWVQRSDNRQGGPSGRDRKQLVVLPGLDKMTDGSATALTPPLQLLRPRLGQLH